MSKDRVKDIIETDFSKLPNANELYKEFVSISEIEKVKEEDFVIDQLMRGRTKSSIIKELSMKHPTNSFSDYDMTKFLDRNDQIVKELEKQKTQLARRHLNAKVKIEEEMAQMFLYTKKLVDEYRSQGDNNNTVAALRTAMDMMVKYSKLAGFYGEDAKVKEPTKNVINIITDQKANIAKKIVKANFNLVTEHEKNDEKKDQNETTDSK